MRIKIDLDNMNFEAGNDLVVWARVLSLFGIRE
jgi:hypothetical protein